MYQDADTAVFTTTDTSPELMQLGQAEAFRILNEHDRCIGDVDPHFDHGSTYQDLDLICREGGHDPIFLVLFHTAVQ